MAKHLLLFICPFLLIYSAQPLYIPVCDCNQAKTWGIIDINKPHYCQKGKLIHLTKHDFQTSIHLSPIKNPQLPGKDGLVNIEWNKKKDNRILLEWIFWQNLFTRNPSRFRFRMLGNDQQQEVWRKHDGKKLYYPVKPPPPWSFTASANGEGKWYSTGGYHALNYLVEKITQKIDLNCFYQSLCTTILVKANNLLLQLETFISILSFNGVFDIMLVVTYFYKSLG
jgi:hypothetical protein